MADSPVKKAPTPFVLDPKVSSEATGTKRPFLDVHLIKQTAASLWMPDGTTEDEKVVLIKSALAMLQGIKPTDEIEGMLASQMVGTHSAAMECLRRAMIPSQTFAGRDQSLKHAAKLLAIYTRQIEALNKHRGKGQQKVTVEHVHVEAGAQAVVGNIGTSQGLANSAPQSDASPKTISYSPAKTLKLPVRAREKQRKT